VTFSIVCPLTYMANSYKLFRVTSGKELEDLSQYNNTPPIINNTNLTHLWSNNQSVVRHLNIKYEDEGELEIIEVNKEEDDNSNANKNNTYSDKKVNDTVDHNTDIEYVLHFTFREILLFSAVIAATDTVAALTFVKEESEPKLFAILFGEGVINDAVCIVLYGIIRNFSSSNEEFTSKTPFKMLGSFMSMFFFSFLIGAMVGCLSSLFLKKLKFIQLNRVQECSIIVFFAFISYTLTEELGLSPIIALLFTGIFMSHYTFYNLSFQAREESSVVSRIMSNIAEAFVFTYLGLTVIYNTQMAFSFSFFFWELIFVCLGRFVAIYGISYIMSALKVRSFNMKNSQKGIMSCAGSIRGAIAFGLAISIDTKNKINKY
jgi:NhaP-type Na+/H+ or K+/H+ antiporter